MRSNAEAQIVLGDDDLLGAISALRRGRRAYCPRARRSPARELLGGTELEGTELLGRSFLKRMASRTAKVVRKGSHVALNVGAKIPGYGAAVDLFRSATGGKGGSAPAGGAGGGGDPEAPPLWQNPMVLGAGALLLVLLLKSKKGQGGGQPIYYAPPPAPAPAAQPAK